MTVIGKQIGCADLFQGLDLVVGRHVNAVHGVKIIFVQGRVQGERIVRAVIEYEHTVGSKIGGAFVDNAKTCLVGLLARDNNCNVFLGNHRHL